MPLSFLNTYLRSAATMALLVLALGFAFSGLRINAWDALLPLFEWMETNWFGVIGKTWGAAFAVVEATHLLSMALLGGAILITDGRLLGLLLRDVPVQTILLKTNRLFVIGLLIAIASGIFMACGVAMKIYYFPVYWIKMLALTAGVLFTFTIKRPLLADGIENLNPWVVRAVAVASLTVWFTVAATGRWIGFSG
jgi:hypothetical protein